MKLYTVDAFTDRMFGGNQAAVCLLDGPRDDDWMQAVAVAINYSETAFLLPQEDGYSLRWFTPGYEVDLCGHATLASAHVLWSEVGVTDAALRFHTRSGLLTATQGDGQIELDFPATPPAQSTPRPGLLKALGVSDASQPVFLGESKFDGFIVVESERALRSMTPDFVALKKIDLRGVIVTSPSDDAQFDFVSRFFAPTAGINEDPVTGSAHCCLTPYWAERLGKNRMTAFQASERGGIVHVQLQGDRVILGGTAVTVLAGELRECPSTISQLA